MQPSALILLATTTAENLALAGVVGLADDAFAFHPLDQRRRLVVADGEAPLDIGGGGLLVGQNDMDGLVVKLVARAGIIVAASIGIAAEIATLVLLVGDRIEIIRRALGLEMG